MTFEPLVDAKIQNFLGLWLIDVTMMADQGQTRPCGAENQGNIRAFP
ncbi:hypothetical protein [Nereida sp. MMG025]|nr:hypothetical protein [Nereida sp. MMG025]MCF6444835.1 hypothetical protein [Nereida sp. MMG025]